uniref:Uncharacterized protein LOC114345598 n=1 Tax=Diabrotica virgifera virgifera TaxID=50390 RepID=A0A6P7H3B5_DIAVI
MDVTQFANTIRLAAEAHIGKSVISAERKSVPWWNSSCENAVEQQKSALKIYSRNKCQENLIALKKTRAKSRYIIKLSKKTSWRQYISSINENSSPSQVWKKIGQIQGKKTNLKISNLLFNQKVIIDNQEIAKVLAENFKKKFHNKSGPNPVSSTLPSPFPYCSPVSQDINYLNSPITYSELKSALKSCKNTAAGPDDLPYIFLKKLSSSCLYKLLEIYNKIWIFHKFPNEWRTSIILPIKIMDFPQIP